MAVQKNQEVVQRLVKKLVAEYAPQKVVLFGSYAGGTPRPDSDIDLLIIKETQERFFDRLFRVRQAISGTHDGIPLDLIVLTPQELNARLEIGDQFIEEILERGRVLYVCG